MFTILTQGTFTQPATAVNQRINVPQSADYFVTKNITQLAAASPTAGVMFEWFGPNLGSAATAAAGAIEWYKSGSAVINTKAITTGGFTYVTTSPTVEPQASNAITSISAANPAVVTQTNTYSNGDRIRIYNTTGDLTIGGMDFTISSVSGSGYTLLGLANVAGNGLAAATAGNTRRISTYNSVEPEALFITNISQASQAVVSTSVDPSLYYVVGMKIYFSVPSSYGMTQMNGLTGVITAVNAVAATGNIGAYNVTVNINSSAFTAFAFPASAGSPVQPLFAMFAPAGASTQFNTWVANGYSGYNFSLQPFHTGQFTPYMYLPNGADSPGGQANDVVIWQCYKFEV